MSAANDLRRVVRHSTCSHGAVNSEDLMLWLVTQVLWFGLAALIMLVDRRLMRQAVDPNEAIEDVDLRDRSATPFLGLMLIFGGLVLPFYLWYSRRSAAAIVAGVVLMVVCAVVVTVMQVTLVQSLRGW